LEESGRRFFNFQACTHAGTAGDVSDTWLDVDGPPWDSAMVFSEGTFRRVAMASDTTAVEGEAEATTWFLKLLFQPAMQMLSGVVSPEQW